MSQHLHHHRREAQLESYFSEGGLNLQRLTDVGMVSGKVVKLVFEPRMITRAKAPTHSFRYSESQKLH